MKPFSLAFLAPRAYSSLLDRIEAMTRVPDEVGLLMDSNYFVTAAWRLVTTLHSLDVSFLSFCVSAGGCAFRRCGLFERLIVVREP